MTTPGTDGGSRWGVLGGTFNPVHIGHLLAAEEARSVLGLKGVVFVPAGEPWMRSGEALASKEDRWNMVLLAVQANPAFVASRVDLDRPGPTYSVDTLTDLLAGSPGPGQYHFILGTDSLAGLPRWKEPERLLRLCRIAAVARPGLDVERVLEALVKALPAAAGRVDVVPGLHIGISATDIRRRRLEGLSIKYRVPEAVESYIMDRGLYQQQGSALHP